MPDSIEENIRQVLDGLKLDEDEKFCDFSLAQQNESNGNYFHLFIFVSNVQEYV